ncbi:EF-hand domain-containing protein [Pseudogemmobacter sp. W21_MBD1_M6]|uniref:EF-hand domain-containing protein n=1 Tax=Pseudogemmobacter sp. W21_MBD1_M6 TaxID=3240271 RepID=UPI003F99DF28
MNRLVLTLASILALGAAQANAQTMVTDTDGDGVYSMDELMAAFPDLTEDAFTGADANEDGMLDAEELKAAQEAGTIPM